jgi:rare lipoprotein A
MTKPLLIGLLALSGCTDVERPSEPASHVPKKTAESPKYHHKEAGRAFWLGKASWYGPGFHHKRTASGEIFDQNKLTAGSRSLPLGTVVEITNLKNGKQVNVTINDRGPWVKGRTIDLSRAAANRLDMVKTGLAPVKITMIAKRDLRPNYRYRKRHLRLSRALIGAREPPPKKRGPYKKWAA